MKNFGGQVELAALADLYDVNIHIFDLSQIDDRGFETILTPFDKDENEQKLNIYINYVNKNHYQAYNRNKFKEPSISQKGGGQASNNKIEYALLNMKNQNNYGHDFTNPNNFRGHSDFTYLCNWVYDLKSVKLGDKNEKPPQCEPSSDDNKYELLNMKDMNNDGDDFTNPNDFRGHSDFTYLCNWVYNLNTG